jgi:hypothetical protein
MKRKLLAFGRISKRKRRRGQPAKQSFSSFLGEQLDVAVEVELRMLADPRRGARARAIREMAEKYKRSPAWVDKAVQRRRSIARTLAECRAGFETTATELERRLSELPADVRGRLLDCPVPELLDLLRREKVGDAIVSTEFIEAVRAAEFLSVKSRKRR